MSKVYIYLSGSTGGSIVNRFKILRKKAIERRIDLLQLIYDANGGHT